MQFDSFIWDKMHFILPRVIGVLESGHYGHINLYLIQNFSRGMNLLQHGFHAGSNSLQQRAASQ
jgi:hypothetical protein